MNYVFLGGVFLAAWALTGLLRRYALHRELLDHPNERSSHLVATPRGGGLSIVLVVLTALPLLWWQGFIEGFDALGLGGAGFLVAVVGWLDDHGHVPARWRLLVHFLAAVWGLYWLGGMPDVTLLGWTLPGAWLLLPVAVYLVWLLNLYNFMDGIDGIAGVEAATVCLAGAALAVWALPEARVLPYGLLALASLGFLVWNFPPAKIFMGDAGSGFVGLWLGLLSIYAAHQAPLLFWAWVILLGGFVVDASMTLVRRWWHGEKVYEAHRSHAYQHLARRFGHRPVTLAYGAINLFWLFPVAAWVVLGGLDGMVGVLVAYTPLGVLAYWLGAGRREANPLRLGEN